MSKKTKKIWTIKNISSKPIWRNLFFIRSFLKSNSSWYIFFLILIIFAYNNSEKIIKSNQKPFLIKKIVFDGNEHVPDVLLLKASGLKYKTNILLPNLHEIKTKLENISWIKSAIIQRKFPNEIYIRISERTPIAILQSKYKLYLIDSEGIVLEHDGIGNFNNLPIVVGEGAETEANYLLQCLEKFSKIRKQLVFAIRIGKRRWNIKINRGIVVKLPERGITQALQILEEISDSNGFFNKDIASIDIRMLDRVIITKRQ